MKVIKRDGRHQDVDFNKITTRISKLINEMGSDNVDPIIVAQKVCSSLHDGVTTSELDKLAAEISVALCTTHPDYGVLAGYVSVSDLHKNIGERNNFVKITEELYKNNIVTDEYYSIVIKHSDIIMNNIDYQKDYSFDYFAIKTLEKAYLIKIENKIIERPQDMIMRVCIGIHGDDLSNIISTYEMMSNKYFTHATPTLFNAGTVRPQLASCFLMGMEDNITDIYKTLSDCAQISKWAGGIGLWIHDIRSAGSSIRNIKGACTGIVPMLKVFNDTAKYVNQEGKRPGSIAIYLSVDHPDIFEFLDLKKNSGDEEMRARDLFYAVWVSDLFMERVEKNEKWSLFCPHECPGMSDVYGKEYEAMYIKNERLGLAKKVVNAQDLWFAICNSQIETGTPYVLYKDAANKKSNQKNIGTIKSSNLCCEIIQYTSKDEIAVCNLASICLPMCIDNGEFNYEKLGYITSQVTYNLNKVIDRTYYPVPETERSNKRHRPIGIGVQGLSDVFMKMRIGYDSEEAREVNARIFETIYYHALKMSMEIAKTQGYYETFIGSPASKGILQFDMWGVNAKMYDWESLKDDIKKYGLRNSLLVAPMPTATTSQLMGNNECFEPITSNIYVRRTLAGEFVMINKYLVEDLLKIGLWSGKMKDKIIYHQGSIQNIVEIPKELKVLYKTAWEMSQKTLINLAADRGAFICQSQSLNLFVPKPSVKILSAMHFYGWKAGLKTGIYYLRTKPAAAPIQFTIDNNICENCSA